MNDQVNGVLRSVLPAVLAYVAGKGWIPAGSVADISAAILAIGAAIWSVQKNTNASKIAQVAAMPEVKKIIADDHTANVVLADEPKVVTKV